MASTSNKSLVIAAAAVVAVGTFYAGRLTAPGSGGSDRAGSSSDGDLSLRSSHSDDESIASAMRAGHGKTGASERSGGLAKSDEKLSARIGDIIRNNDPIERNRAWLAFIDKLDPSQLEAAVESFRALGITDSRFSEYAMLLTAWAKKDPESALKYAQANTHSGFASGTILSAWATYNPEAAIRWAQANYTGDGANPYLAGIIRGLAPQDPVRATGLLTSMPFGKERSDALEAILPTILGQGPDAARKWTSDIADQQLRDGTMMRVANELAKTDPKGTADWLLANPGEATKRNMDDVLGIWAEQDKSAAVAYYQTLPPGEERSNALRGIVNSLAMQSPQDAANFMESHRADMNDHIVQQFVWHSMGEDPAIAASYISRLSNPDDQNNMYRRTLDTWLNRDMTAAQAWVGRNQLPDQIQQFVQRKVQEINQRKQ